MKPVNRDGGLCAAIMTDEKGRDRGTLGRLPREPEAEIALVLYESDCECGQDTLDRDHRLSSPPPADVGLLLKITRCPSRGGGGVYAATMLSPLLRNRCAQETRDGARIAAAGRPW